MKPPTSKFLSPGIVFVSKTSNPKTTFPSLSPRQRTHSEVSGPFLPPLRRFLPGRILTAEITAFFGRKTCTILTHLMDENVYIYIYICHNLIITVKTRVLSHMMAYISHKISGHCILGQKNIGSQWKAWSFQDFGNPQTVSILTYWAYWLHNWLTSHISPWSGVCLILFCPNKFTWTKNIHIYI